VADYGYKNSLSARHFLTAAFSLDFMNSCVI
jgi:hypothetical protein